MMDPPDFDKAVECIKRGVNIHQSFELRPYYNWGYMFLGVVLADRGQKVEALKYLKRAKSYFEDQEIECWLPRTNRALSKLE